MFSTRWFRYASRLRNLRHHFRYADWPALYAAEQQRSGRRLLPWSQLLVASWRYGTSFNDYYVLRWFAQSPARRRQLLTTSLLYELERQHNDLAQARLIRDKLLFNRHFADLLGRPYWHGPALQQQPAGTRPPERVVFKRRLGGCGKQVFFPAERFTRWQDVLSALQTQGDPEAWICEPYLTQHPELERLHPGSVNTLRVVTWQAGGVVQIWARMLRIGVKQGADNLSQGGLAVWVDPDGGIRHPAQYLYPGRPDCSHHPLTGEAIQGFQLPFVAEVDALITAAARRLPLLGCVGWDVAFTPQGPCLIEANERWSTIMQTLPGAQGLRALAEAAADLTLVYR